MMISEISNAEENVGFKGQDFPAPFYKKWHNHFLQDLVVFVADITSSGKIGTGKEWVWRMYDNLATAIKELDIVK